MLLSKIIDKLYITWLISLRNLSLTEELLAPSPNDNAKSVDK